MKTFINYLLVTVILAFYSQSIEARVRKHNVKKHEPAPYHVHLWVYDPFMYKWPGSGVLITKRHVLTAAINILNYNRWDLGFGSERQNNLQVITSFYGFVHENFNDTTDNNNVGLIVIPEPIKISELISPVKLPRQDEIFPVERSIGYIAAFSYVDDMGPLSTKLEHGIQKIISTAECERNYPHLHGIIDNFFCATDKNFNVCGGAQGSGLVVKRGDENVLAGIISFGNIWRDCKERKPPGFVRIAEYVDWIMQKTKDETEFIYSSKNTNNQIGYIE